MEPARGLYSPLKLIVPSNGGACKDWEEVEAATDVLVDAILALSRGTGAWNQRWYTRKGDALPSSPGELLLAMLEHGGHGLRGDQDFFMERGIERICLDVSEYFERVIGPIASQILRGDQNTRMHLNWARQRIKERFSAAR